MQKFVESARLATVLGGELAARDWRMIGTLIVVASVVLSVLLKMRILEHITPILAAM